MSFSCKAPAPETSSTTRVTRSMSERTILHRHPCPPRSSSILGPNPVDGGGHVQSRPDMDIEQSFRSLSGEVIVWLSSRWLQVAATHGPDLCRNCKSRWYVRLPMLTSISRVRSHEVRDQCWCVVVEQEERRGDEMGRRSKLAD